MPSATVLLFPARPPRLYVSTLRRFDACMGPGEPVAVFFAQAFAPAQQASEQRQPQQYSCHPGKDQGEDARC